MKKRMLGVLALVLALSMVFASCASGGDSGASAAPPPADTGSAAADPAAEGQQYEEPEISLVLTQHDPDESMPGQYCFDWADMVKEKSNGRLEIQVNNNGVLAKPTESLDMVRSGAVDLAWGLQSFYPDVFPLTDAIALPMLDLGTGAEAARATMDIFENTDLLTEEYAEFKTIMIRPSYSSPILSDRQINSVADFSGLKMRITAPPLIDFFDHFDVLSEGVPINELYSVLQNGAFNGAITDWHAVYSFNLEDVSPFFADETISYTTYYFLMNLEKYNSLPDWAKQVIDECSGQAALELNIDSWDTIVEEGKAGAEAAGDTIYRLDDATRAAMQEAADDSIQNWIAEMEGKGQRGQEMYDTLIETSAKYMS